MIYSHFLAFLPCVALHSSIHRQCQGSVTVCYKVPLSCKLKADLQPAHSLLLAPLFALCGYLFFPLIKVSHPSLSAASAESQSMCCSQCFSIVVDLATPHFLEVKWCNLTPLSLPVHGAVRMLFSRSSHRIPEESLYQTGIIRQRQSCLESHKSEDQELPILSLNPCNSSKGTVPKAQVRCVVYPFDAGWEQATGAASR